MTQVLCVRKKIMHPFGLSDVYFFTFFEISQFSVPICEAFFSPENVPVGPQIFARPALFFQKVEKSQKKLEKIRKNLEFLNFLPGFGPELARVGPNWPKLYGPDVGPRN